MGRAVVFIQTKKYNKAVIELTYLIDFLNRTLKPDDRTAARTRVAGSRPRAAAGARGGALAAPHARAAGRAERRGLVVASVTKANRPMKRSVMVVGSGFFM